MYVPRTKNIALFILILCTYTAPGYAEMDDLLDLEEDIPAGWEISRGTNVTPQFVVDLLTSVSAQQLLLENLYLRTNALNQRSLQDLPEFYFPFLSYNRDPCFYRNDFLTHFFYNQTWQNYFTKESSKITSYIGLENQTLLQQAEIIEDTIDLPEVLGLFTDLRVQEHRTGILFQMYIERSTWTVDVRMPLYYLLHNFYLTPQQIKNIQNAEFFQDEEPNDEPPKKQVQDFGAQNFVRDYFGIGDLRITADYALINKPTFLLAFGPYATFPTAWAWKNGLIGKSRRKDSPVPFFDFLTLITLAFDTALLDQPLAKEIALNFFVGALDTLATNLLQTGLGNGGHVELGMAARKDLQIDATWHMRSRASLSYFLPATQFRYFLQNKVATDFTSRNYGDPNQALANIQFFNQQFINTLYPQVYLTQVFPGFVFNFTTGLYYEKRHVDFMVGYDLWWQSAEHFGQIKMPHEQKFNLRYDIAKKSAALLNKFFSSVHYRHPGKHDWRLGLYVDRSFLGHGIGHDFNVAIQFEIDI